MRAFLQAIILVTAVGIATAILGPPLPCPNQRPECTQLEDIWLCEADYKQTACDFCVRSYEDDGIECTASCYKPITTATAPVIVAARTAALLQSTLESLSDGNLFQLSPDSPNPGEFEQEFTQPPPASLPGSAGTCSRARILTTSTVGYKAKFQPWDCGEDVFRLPKVENSTELFENFILMNPLWCSLSLTGKNRVPVKSDLYVQGASAFWKQAVQAAMEHVVSVNSGAWSNIFKTGSNGRPKFTIKKKKGKRYIVVLFFQQTYLREVRTICS